MAFKFSIGDYVEGYRYNDGHLKLMYTRGWVVASCTNDANEHCMLINEDKPYMFEKYNEKDLSSIVTDASVSLIVSNDTFKPNKVIRDEFWWDKYRHGYDTELEIEIANEAIEDTSYFGNITILKNKKVAKIFVLDGVLQVPNSDGIQVDKAIQYMQECSEEDLSYLLIKLNDTNYDLQDLQDIASVTYESTSYNVREHFRMDNVFFYTNNENKLNILEDLCKKHNLEDVLLIDADLEFIRSVQDGDVDIDNLRAVHVSSIVNI